jgi:glycine oxidase
MNAMPPATWDAIIVGQGLAGTTLAWHLLDAGQRVLVLDRQEPITTSKIAAGLITPITGKQLALSWRCDEFLPVADAFYSNIEARTGQRFFTRGTAIRLFTSPTERTHWSKRCDRLAFQPYLIAPTPDPIFEPTRANAPDGGFAMRAAQLDVAAYLAASRGAFTARQSYGALTLDWTRDVHFEPNAITLHNQTTQVLISCEGFAGTHNPYFTWVPSKAAKGEILTIRVHEPMPPNTLHSRVWIAPTPHPDIFKVGSTYEWTNLDNAPTPAARADIEHRLATLLRVPYTVLDHQAAVRPIIRTSKARVGFHPTHERLGYFNGLGSKGALIAPWFAACFTQAIVHQTPLPDDVNVRKLHA